MTRGRDVVRGRTARGFTIIELMVAAALAMLLLAGAFEMHTAMNRQTIRQQEIADMQQSLRVAMQVIARSIRDAGTGLGGGNAQFYSASIGGPLQCPTPTGAAPNPNPIDNRESCLWAVQFSNANTYQQPKNSWDTTVAGDNDTDPDWLRVVSFDGGTVVRAGGSPPPAGHNPSAGVIWVSDVRPFSVGSFFLVNNGYPAFTDANFQATLGWRTSCIRQVTAITPDGGASVGGLVSVASNNNNPNPGDPCLSSVFPPAGVTVPGKSQVVYAYPVDRSVVFRVDPTPAAGTPARLLAWYSSPTVPSYYPWSTGLQNWQPLAENIENMQIAMVMNDGTLCGNNLNSVDSTALCNPQNIRAVRVTLVARSSSSFGSTSGGVFSGWISQGTGGRWEDFAQPASQDGYLRRSLTTEIQIRNVPWGR